MDSASTVAGAVAAGRSAAGFIRIVRSQQKVSLFRPSAGATGREQCVHAGDPVGWYKLVKSAPLQRCACHADSQKEFRDMAGPRCREKHVAQAVPKYEYEKHRSAVKVE